MWIAGLATFASCYGIALLSGTFAVADEGAVGAAMAVPIFGPPAYALATESGGDGRPVLGLTTLLALGQATGAALFIAGFAAERRVYERNDVVGAAPVPTTRLLASPAGVALVREF
jgi:hypothetical protein